VTSSDIRAVSEVLRSGWITTGEIAAAFEKELSRRLRAEALCVNSATAGMETVLRAFEIGPGDEVITSPYTYTSTASVIVHTGAKMVLADVNPGSFHIDPAQIASKTTPRTKAVIPVDFAGIPCDYREIRRVLESREALYRPRPGTLQSLWKRPLLLADAAHSLGASARGRPVGSLADVSVFSFHAVKNVTTAEGGAVLVNHSSARIRRKLLKDFRLWSFHGQDVDARRERPGGWEYDIVVPGYKFNMSDMQAALGLSQFKRLDSILERRRALYARYGARLRSENRLVLPPAGNARFQSACHLYPVRIRDFGRERRDTLIRFMKSNNIAVNVHFKPIPLLTAYRRMGYRIEDYPEALDAFQNEITLPLHLSLKMSDVDRVCRTFLEGVGMLL
jgi:dTDP-4-amino-4,6-dideoxygalactose transaminase